jgi:hypothetical protein
MFLCWFVGAGGNLAQLSFFAIINYLSSNIVSLFTIGTALSMMLTGVIRVVILTFMGSNSSNIIAIIIYFAIGMAFNLLDLFLNIKFFMSSV